VKLSNLKVEFLLQQESKTGEEDTDDNSEEAEATLGLISQQSQQVQKQQQSHQLTPTSSEESFHIPQFEMAKKQTDFTILESEDDDNEDCSSSPVPSLHSLLQSLGPFEQKTPKSQPALFFASCPPLPRSAAACNPASAARHFCPVRQVSTSSPLVLVAPPVEQERFKRRDSPSYHHQHLPSGGGSGSSSPSSMMKSGGGSGYPVTFVPVMHYQ